MFLFTFLNVFSTCNWMVSKSFICSMSNEKNSLTFCKSTLLIFDGLSFGFTNAFIIYSLPIHSSNIQTKNINISISINKIVISNTFYDVFINEN